MNELSEDFKSIFDLSEESLKELKDKRLLLTGGTGFFGKWILGFFNYANEHHHLNLTVYILSRNPESFLKEFPEFINHHFHFIKGDIRTFKFSEKVDFVIHGATEASAKMIEQQPEEMFEVIFDGTKNLLKNAEVCTPSRILIISSGAVYGSQLPEITHQPDESLMGPDLHTTSSTYAVGKQVSELLGTFHAKKTGQITTFARCFAFVGPFLPLDTHFAIGNFINDCLSKKDIIINGDGTPARSYLYASDLVVWLLKALTHGESCRSYNVGSEKLVNIKELAEFTQNVWETISKQKVNVKILIQPNLTTPPKRYVPSTQRARTELSLKETVTLEEGLLKTFKFLMLAKKKESQYFLLNK